MTNEHSKNSDAPAAVARIKISCFAYFKSWSFIRLLPFALGDEPDYLSIGFRKQPMEIVFSILIGLGLSAACGFRVFIPLLVAGIGIHAGALHPAPDFTWLGSTPALIGFGTATILEIAAFYIPWLDNTLDVAATPAAVIAGTVVAGSFIVDMNPWARWSLSLIAGGGLAAAVQTGTMGLRGLSLAGTGGLANPIVSTLEWFAATLTSLLAVLAPVLLLASGLVFVGMLWFVWQRHQASSSIQKR